MDKIILLVLITTLSIPIIGGSAEDAFATAIRNAIDNPGFYINTLPGTDDGSTGAVNLGFVVDFFTNVGLSQIFVNNNGNITFDNPFAAFDPADLDITNTAEKIIAPFFADVDTRFIGNQVTYGQDMVNGHAAFAVNWIGVDCLGGTFQNGLNAFQIVLIDRSDIRVGDFDMEFNYDNINWEAGTASGGDAACLGGTTAEIGYSAGSPLESFEFTGSGDVGAFLDTGPVATSLIQNSLNSAIDGRYTIPVRNGEPDTVPMEIIGGEIIQIESVSLLLTGAQSLSWMIPITLSIIGIGLVIIRKNTLAN